MKNLFTIAFLVIITVSMVWGVQALKEAAKLNYSDLNHRMEKIECSIGKKTDPAFKCESEK